MTELSPAAKAVLDAVCDNTEPDCDTQHLIAAALRAVADQVAAHHSKTFLYSIADYLKLHSIATELENHQ